MPRGSAANCQLPGTKARPQDCQEHAFQAQDEMQERCLRMRRFDQAGPDAWPFEGMRLRSEEVGFLHKRLRYHCSQGGGESS